MDPVLIQDTHPASIGSGPTVPSSDDAESTQDIPELARGALVARYVILSRIGAGGMGVIYAAYDPELDRKVALKVLRQLNGPGPDGQKRLLREAQALARLQHPNVVAVHDAGTWNDRIWVAMEFVKGQTLTDWLKTSDREWHKVLAVMTDVARGLSAAHRLGLVHRDVKPDNIMISTDGRIRVMDFGLVRTGDEGEQDPHISYHGRAIPVHPHLQEHLTEDGAVMGTPAYMAPEQFGGLTTDDRTDQFSWCVTTWEALFGERPFHGETLHALEAAIQAGRPRPPAGRSAPRWLRRVLERGMRCMQEQRFPHMQDLLFALERGSRRRAGILTALAATASAALVVGVWQAWSWRQEQFQRLRATIDSAQIELRISGDFLATAARVGAHEPRLRAVLGTDPATIQDVVHEFARTLGQDTLVLCESGGRGYVTGDDRLLSLCELVGPGPPSVRGVRATRDRIYLYACAEILLDSSRLGHVCLASDALQIQSANASPLGFVTADNTLYSAQFELAPRRAGVETIAEVMTQLGQLAPDRRLHWLLGDPQQVGVDEIRLVAWEFR